MLASLTQALDAWGDDPSVHLVVIEAAGQRAFCAGGDVRTMREWVLAGDFSRVDAFFVHEYALNRTIARYPKPYVALIDGIWMGGGVGLAVHGGYRVVTEHAQVAMPETQIGMIPDVGTSFVLPRLRGAFGMYLGLTGQRIGPADACWLGLATHYVPRQAMTGLADALADVGLAALAERAVLPPPGELEVHTALVDAIFTLPSLPEIVAALERRHDPWSLAALAALRTASPHSLRLTFEALRAGAQRTFEQCQQAELELTRIVTRHPDFAEGVRAAVIDKDRTPHWAIP